MRNSNVNKNKLTIETSGKKGYKHASLGWIPKDWEVVRMKDIANIQGGYAFDSKNFKDNGEFQIVKMSNVYNAVLDLKRSTSFLDNLTTKEKEFLIKKDDIIISLTGTIGKQDYGYSYKIDTQQNLVLNQRLAKITSKSDTVDPNYLSFELKTDRLLKQFFYSSRGGTGNQANVSTIDLEKIKLPLPPLSEQRCIAALLTTWDEAITKTQQLIEQLKQRNNGLMQQLLTGKKRLKGFSGEWKEYSYHQLLKIVKRPIGWNDEALYKLISVRRRSGGIFFREALYGYQIKVKDLRNAREGDFLFSKMQIVHGASGIVTKEYDNYKISGSYIATIARDPRILNMHFFNWISKLPHFYHQTLISSYGVHIEKMTFDFDSFLQLKLKIPSYKEQASIVTILEKSTQEVNLYKQRLTALKEQKRGLMQVLLTGEKRLKR